MKVAGHGALSRAIKEELWNEEMERRGERYDEDGLGSGGRDGGSWALSVFFILVRLAVARGG